MPYQPSRRGALKAVAACSQCPFQHEAWDYRRRPGSREDRSGNAAINPAITSYIGEVDFFKEEGLTVEVTRFSNFAPICRE